MDTLSTVGNNKLSGQLENPFNKDLIERVYVSSQKSSFPPYNWSHYGEVSFIKGNTKGVQVFRGESFDNVTEQIRLFILNEL